MTVVSVQDSKPASEAQDVVCSNNLPFVSISLEIKTNQNLGAAISIKVNSVQQVG